MENISTLTDGDLLKRLDEWRLPSSTAPLPHNAGIEPVSLVEYEELRREAATRELRRPR
ncbi:MAG TPA: hypothetical protein VJ935_00330 [Acidimicrobiia bacterium]|nr:hypothetical protein [Acidimicrobiia bacterium]